MARLPAFTVVDRVDGFMFGESRDLTGFEDDTENSQGDRAFEVAFASDGSAVVAVQRWVHDLDAFESLTPSQQNDSIGRDRITNEELEDSPKSAHVKRTAQETFEPEAFVLRRSMPWRDHRGAGLMFVSFSATLSVPKMGWSTASSATPGRSRVRNGHLDLDTLAR